MHAIATAAIIIFTIFIFIILPSSKYPAIFIRSVTHIGFEILFLHPL